MCQLFNTNLNSVCGSSSAVELHLAKVEVAGSNPVSRFYTKYILVGVLCKHAHFGGVAKW